MNAQLHHFSFPCLQVEYFEMRFVYDFKIPPVVERIDLVSILASNLVCLDDFSERYVYLHKDVCLSYVRSILLRESFRLPETR